MNLNVLVEVNHEAETLLDLCRKDSSNLQVEWFNVLLQACDILTSIIDGIEGSGTDEGIVDTDEILETLKHTIVCVKEGPQDFIPKESSAPVGNNELTGDEFSLDFSMLSPEIIEKFVQEGLDLLDDAEAGVLTLSKNNDDLGPIDKIFRDLHTFKGNCGFMSFDDMHRITHSLETISEGIRDFMIPCTEEILNTMLSAVDKLKECLFDLLKGGKGEFEEFESFQKLLQEIEPKSGAQPLKAQVNLPKASAKKSSSKNILLIEDDASSRKLVKKILEKNDYKCFACETAEEGINELMNQSIDVCITDINLPGMSGKEFISEVNAKFSKVPVIALSGDKDRELLKDLMKLELYGFLDKPVKKDDLIHLVENALSHAVRKKVQQGVADDTPSGGGSAVKTRRDIRVDLTKLDLLIDLVGELIIAEAMVTKHPSLEGMELPGFERASHRLHLITNELQDIAMAVRMVPVSGVFSKMRRLVHDVSQKTGKPLKLNISGETTEVDKVVVDMIADPLVHMIRNSADHGIESPEEREAAGKDRTGQVKLEAIQRASEVLIIISDDGRGLNREKILEKCRNNGLISDSGESLSDQEAYQMIFEPGFSTAAQVTDLSGRGVGMDVVKKNIELIKGRIEIDNNPGKGCSFIIHIPLTLATIEGMLVKVGTTKYTIPITSIRESLRPNHSMITQRPDGQEFVKIRENLLPIFRLYQLHDLKPESEDLTQGILIVLDLIDGSICLFVDDILYQVQTVIKNLSGYMGKVKGISGCNILGNGEVALILDPESILKCLPSDLKLVEAG